MKLHKLLSINGEHFNVISDDVRLNLFNAGRAMFKVKSQLELSGLVRFSMGFDPENVLPFFSGYIESSTTVDAEQQSIFCREFGGALNQRLPLALRQCSLVDVLTAISNTSKILFSPAEAGYSTRKVACVNSMGLGYGLMDQLGYVFSIPQYLWQQQADGSIYVGSWGDSLYSTRPINTPQKFMKSSGVGNRATIPVVPALRPGTLFNGQYLTALQFSGNNMQLTWHKNPWALRGAGDGS